MATLESLLEHGIYLNSPLFLGFLALLAVLYYVLPRKAQNTLLLVASYAFYCINAWQYALLMLGTTALTYAAGRATDRQESTKTRRAIMAGCIILLLAVLAFFKYAIRPLAASLQTNGIIGGSIFELLILPMGISYYTFQTIGYLVDVFHKKVAAERNFVNYALYVSFFPQIMAGPIGRASELLPQYRQPRPFEYSNMVAGLQRFLQGAFRKIVVADGIGIIVTEIYKNLEQYRGLTLFTVMILYAVQIYADFAGYTDMAVGAARIFGLTLRENFKTPYYATNFSGLWQRWHMSLTSWLNDYVFTPLTWSRWYNKLFFGKRADEHKPAVIPNIFIVFLLSGIWHGDTLNYVVWGLLHGILRSGEELLLRARKKRGRKLAKNEPWLKRNAKRLSVFLIWSATEVVFRTTDLRDAGYVFANMFRLAPLKTFRADIFEAIGGGAYLPQQVRIFLFFIIAGLAIMALLDSRIHTQNSDNNALATFSKTKRWLLYWAMGLLVMLLYFKSLGAPPMFIYEGH